MTLSRRQFVLTAAALPLSASAAMAAGSAPPQVQKIDVKGADNLYRIAPNFYRSAQPTKEGFANLKQAISLRSVVSLRHWNDDGKLAEGAGLDLKRVPINTWRIGSKKGEKAVQAMRLIKRAEAKGPVLVHCQHGSDRTGCVVALYRMLYQGVDREVAIKEMMEGGFGFHAVWAALPEWGSIPAFLRRVDLADFKRRVEAA